MNSRYDIGGKETIKEKKTKQIGLGYSKNNKKETDSYNNCFAVVSASEPLAVLIHLLRPPAKTLQSLSTFQEKSLKVPL